MLIGLRSRALMLFAVVLVAATGGEALAKDIKTDKGKQVLNWTIVTIDYMGVPTTFFVQEDGKKVIDFTRYKTFDAADIARMKAADIAAYPTITPTSDATWAYDCHGYTFKSGGVWIDDPQVDPILADQGWKKNANPKKGAVGDIAVWRDGGGGVTHSGIVTAVDVNGNVTEVQSKWGARGDYKHNPDVGPYGTKWDVYSGGSVLKDPPFVPDDLSDFEARGIPVTDVKTDWQETYFDQFPSATFDLTSHSGTIWDYALSPPSTVTSFAPGDVVTLYAEGITGAGVASGLSGLWALDSFTSDFATWKSLTTGSLSGDLDGFLVFSDRNEGDAYFRETVGGDVGRTIGPTPELSSASLLLVGMLPMGLAWWRRRKA